MPHLRQALAAWPAARAASVTHSAHLHCWPGARHSCAQHRHSHNDPSGERLRDWMGVDREIFYDEARVAILPMGFCFPGYDEHGGDLPPRRECASSWHNRLFAAAPEFALMLVIGTYAQRYHLGDRAKKTVGETVSTWCDYGPRIIPLPHPSWRNNAWLKKNPWFEKELLPVLQRRVRRALSGT